MQEIFLQLKYFYDFLKSLDFIQVSLELFIPDAATDQCRMGKTIKHYRIREVMYIYSYYQPCEILKRDNLNETDIWFLTSLELLFTPFPANVLKILVFPQLLCMSGSWVFLYRHKICLNLWSSGCTCCGRKGRKCKKFQSPCWILLFHLICQSN